MPSFLLNYLKSKLLEYVGVIIPEENLDQTHLNNF